jgi:hypothetical protein
MQRQIQLLNFKEMNPLIQFDGSPFTLPRDIRMDVSPGCSADGCD